MAEEFTPVVESTATPEVQARAEKLGWIPPSRFKGDPERFIDAEQYIERGETVLPIVKEHNRRLESELAAVKAEARATAEALKAAQTAIEEIEVRHTVATQKAVEEARRQVKAQLAAASEAGDHEGVAELTDQLTKLNTAEAEAGEGKKPEAKPVPRTFTPPPALAEWNLENPWFGKDTRKTALALGIAQELRLAGDTSTGRDFFEKVKAEVENTLGGSLTPPSKVEGARGSGEGGGGEPQAKKASFAALPAEARAACDADAKRFVGPGKMYKDMNAWRARYAEIYFGG